MDELKPCPFCGVKPDIVYCGPGVYVSCCNDDCPCTCEAWGENEDKAEEAWNTRACEILEGDGTGEALPEIRTCKMENVPASNALQCSSCSSYVATWDMEADCGPIRFCPSCGAEVVEQ